MWKRIIIAGVAAELFYAGYIYFIAPSPQVAYEPIGFFMAFVLFVIGGGWASRPTEKIGPVKVGPLTIGLWVGIVGAAFYYLLQIPDIIAGEQAFPAMAFYHHATKMLGGAVGAVVYTIRRAKLAQRRG